MARKKQTLHKEIGTSYMNRKDVGAWCWCMCILYIRWCLHVVDCLYTHHRMRYRSKLSPYPYPFEFIWKKNRKRKNWNRTQQTSAKLFIKQSLTKLSHRKGNVRLYAATTATDCHCQIRKTFSVTNLVFIHLKAH